MAIPLPHTITDPPDGEAVQANFDALKKAHPYSRKDLKIEDPHKVGDPNEPAFQNSWVNFDTATFHGARFWKDPTGMVHLEGLVKNGAAAPSTIFTLPAGYRPSNGHMFAVVTGNPALGRVDVAATGNVVWQGGGTNVLLTLSGITFRQEQ